MQRILLSREEVARRAKELYENSIRKKVERLMNGSCFLDILIFYQQAW
ncbi:hypothetical protein [Nostoc sp.]